MVNPKETLEAYRVKIEEELQKAESIKSKYTVLVIELKAQRDVVNGLLNEIYPPTPKQPDKVVFPKRKK